MFYKDGNIMAFTTHISVIDGVWKSDDSAWKRFNDIYSPLIRLHGHDCGLDSDSLDDLVQEVLISVASNTQNFTYDPAKGRFRDFLRSIIRHRANDILRKKYRIGKVPVIEMDNPSLDDLFLEEWQKHVEKTALDMLKKNISAKHYQIYELLVIHRKRVKEVASFFGLPEQTIYSIRKRTEEKLKQIIEKIDN